MAILKGINGGSFSGSVGKVTFRKGLKGKTIASQKAESVSNPRTYAQQEQRMFMKTAVTAYSAMKEICNHSFEGVSFGQKSMAKFIKLNLEQIRNYSTSSKSCFTVRKNGYVAPQPYIVSKGSLDTIELTTSNTSIVISLKGEPLNVINKDFGFMANNYNLKPGDQIEIVGLYSNNEKLDDWDEDFQDYVHFSYSRYVISKDVKTSDKILSDDLSGFNEKLFSERVGNKIFLETDGRGSGNISIICNNAYLWCASIIISRKQGSKWLRSTSEMIINGRAAPKAYMYKNVIKSYNATSAKYLNNATD